jgi:hypothetical protein
MSEGLICAPAFQNATTALYLKKGDEIVSPVLVEPVVIKAQDQTTAATLFVDGAGAGAYQGAINIVPGTNGTAVAAGAGITVRTAAGPSTIVEVGTNAQANNLLYIAGASGVSQVNDPVYNPAVALKAITMVASNPLCAPAAGNTGEIFRCAQAGVAAAATAAVGNTFTVPKSGWYSMQMEVKLENAAAPAAPSINVPITPVGTIDIGETLTFAFVQGVVLEPYGAMECVSSEFLASAITQQGGNVIRQYVSQHLFQAGSTYSFSLRSTSAAWNIGENGQIKVELIAMC